ncbi:MAG TPA: FtsQ-type POTRA domain-containing protein [Granulicella sp.]|nr:FtsQ-type POTRA domain-containing protein [Granulicella sp.]
MIDEPEETSAPERGSSPAPRRRAQRASAKSRPEKPQRDFDDDFAGSSAPPSNSPGEDFYPSRRAGGVRLRFSGSLVRLPRTLWGRIVGGLLLLAFLGGIAGALLFARNFFLHDERFVLQSTASIEIVGNTHITRDQLLAIFGDDLERNIFRISLADRRRQLEVLPWVQRATVMRLLPDRLRIEITERTPVAFVRQGTQIGLIDASGVLLDMPPNVAGDPQYSFPVITGLSASDPLSTRAARMELYTRFTSSLDSTGEKISAKLSEIDLSDPEDVKALIPEGWADILVHFGDTAFLARYQRFQQLLPEWRTQYPRLASVDMRYERQVVLEMQPGTTAPAPSDPGAAPAKPAGDKPIKSAARSKVRGRSAKKSPAKPTSSWHPRAISSHTVATSNSVARNPATMVNPGALHPAQQASH